MNFHSSLSVASNLHYARVLTLPTFCRKQARDVQLETGNVIALSFSFASQLSNFLWQTAILNRTSPESKIPFIKHVGTRRVYVHRARTAHHKESFYFRTSYHVDSPSKEILQKSHSAYHKLMKIGTR